VVHASVKPPEQRETAIPDMGSPVPYSMTWRLKSNEGDFGVIGSGGDDRAQRQSIPNRHSELQRLRLTNKPPRL
jgi:hypothetical protein